MRARPAYGDVLGMLPQFRAMATEAGRHPGSIPITVFGVEEDRALIERYREAGAPGSCSTCRRPRPTRFLPVLDRCAH